MFKKPIKASQIGNLTDARYFAAWGVEWLGFCLNSKNENYLSPSEAAAIKDWVEGPKMVGEFGIQDPEEIYATAEMLQLDAVQIGPFSSSEEAMALDGLTIIKEVVIDAKTTISSIQKILDEFEPYVALFLLDFRINNMDWSKLKLNKLLPVTGLQSICTQYQLILGIDVNPENVDELLNAILPYGLDVMGGTEEKVGLKSFDELDSLFEAMEES